MQNDPTPSKERPSGVEPPHKRGRPGRPKSIFRKTPPERFQFQLSEAQKEKVLELGGGAWIRQQIDKAVIDS